MDLFERRAGFRVVGFDPSLRNWGVSKGILIPGATDDTAPKITIQELAVIQPVLPTGKQVRQNSHDLEAAHQLCLRALAYAKGAQAIFVEVPVGSQSARAMASYGVCVGVLGALRATGIPFYEVTPNEVKMISVGKKTASKEEMIRWAMSQHPDANWPYYKEFGVDVLSAAKAEHMADATAAIHAGVNTNSFKQSLHLLKFKAA